MFNITKGMNRVFSRRSRSTCGACGLAVPVYPGRYPTKCPNCNEPFGDKPVDNVIEALVNDIVEQNETEPKAIGLDKVMQFIAAAGLINQMLGVDVDPVEDRFNVNFSDDASQEDMKKLVDSVKAISSDADFQETNNGKIKWTMVVYNPRTKTDPEVKGDVGFGVDLSGDVQVRKQRVQRRNQMPSLPKSTGFGSVSAARGRKPDVPEL